jgi:hypothetical protein
VWPSAGCSSELAVAYVDPARHRQRLDGAQAQRRGAGHVVLVVDIAQRALGRAGLGAQPDGGLLAHAQRQLREGEPAQDVVEVGVGREQPVGLEPCLAEERGQRLELVRK